MTRRKRLGLALGSVVLMVGVGLLLNPFSDTAEAKKKDDTDSVILTIVEHITDVVEEIHDEVKEIWDKLRKVKNDVTDVKTVVNNVDANVNMIKDQLNTGGGGQEGNHTLRWDTVQPAAQRFVTLVDFGNAAVLDKETGLVWEQSPATTTHTWSAARFQCADRTTGGRKGWRLPSYNELASLVDPTVASPGPTLPTGHPFINVQSSGYWSATTDAANPSSAWVVNFGDGDVDTIFLTDGLFVWCARSGHNDGSQY